MRCSHFLAIFQYANEAMNDYAGAACTVADDRIGKVQLHEKRTQIDFDRDRGLIGKKSQRIEDLENLGVAINYSCAVSLNTHVKFSLSFFRLEFCKYFNIIAVLSQLIPCREN